MTMLEALKRVRYPRGANGREYQAGERFASLSDRDTKILTLTRVARQAPDESVPVVAEQADPPATRRRGRPPRYLRSDMRAEE